MKKTHHESRRVFFILVPKAPTRPASALGGSDLTGVEPEQAGEATAVVGVRLLKMPDHARLDRARHAVQVPGDGAHH